jgi:hypothetical protein
MTLTLNISLPPLSFFILQLELCNTDEPVKIRQTDGFVKSSPARTRQGAQKIIVGAIHELPLHVRRSDEVEAQSRSERDSWTFYETTNTDLCLT